MAKAKKSESSKTETKATKPEAEAPKKKTAASGGAGKKAAGGKKGSASAAAGGQPMIDTNFAAGAAAKMLMARSKKSAGPTAVSPNASAEPNPESSMFKQLKAGLNKTSSTTMSNLLDKSAAPDLTKSHTAFHKQVGHNQTYGADVTRTGVPRRNPG